MCPWSQWLNLCYQIMDRRRYFQFISIKNKTEDPMTWKNSTAPNFSSMLSLESLTWMILGTTQDMDRKAERETMREIVYCDGRRRALGRGDWTPATVSRGSTHPTPRSHPENEGINGVDEAPHKNNIIVSTRFSTSSKYCPFYGIFVRFPIVFFEHPSDSFPLISFITSIGRKMLKMRTGGLEDIRILEAEERDSEGGRSEELLGNTCESFFAESPLPARKFIFMAVFRPCQWAFWMAPQGSSFAFVFATFFPVLRTRDLQVMGLKDKSTWASDL